MIPEPHYKKYTGAALKAYNKTHDLDPYFPSDGLVRAVEVARLLQRPLLLRGEPGAGKTRLAEALAFELHGAKYQRFFLRWNVKSTTKAQEGLYTYDHLRRLPWVRRQIAGLGRGRFPQLYRDRSGGTARRGVQQDFQHPSGRGHDQPARLLG